MFSVSDSFTVITGRPIRYRDRTISPPIPPLTQVNRPNRQHERHQFYMAVALLFLSLTHDGSRPGRRSGSGVKSLYSNALTILNEK
jgi:hypothetical protein